MGYDDVITTLISLFIAKILFIFLIFFVDCFHTKEDAFPDFFARVLALPSERTLTITEKVFYIVFLVNCFQSFEDPMVRQQAMKYVLREFSHSIRHTNAMHNDRLVSHNLWFNLSSGRLKRELKTASPKLRRFFEAAKKKEADAQPKQVQYLILEW